MDWEERADRAAQGFARHPVRKAVKWVLLIFFAGVLVSLVVGGVRLLVLPARSAAEIAEKTLDADNVLYNYEWFKLRRDAVLALEGKVKQGKGEVAAFKEEAGPRTGWTFEDRTEYARLRSIAAGLENQRRDLVAEYNARARMANRKIFRLGEPDALPLEMN